MAKPKTKTKPLAKCGPKAPAPVHPKAITRKAPAPALPAAEYVPISAIRPWEGNPRKNDGEPVRKVAESIARFGFGAPIVARKANGEIIAGHTRYKAAKKLALETVPVRFLDISEADAHSLALADNRIGQEAAWDDDLLRSILAQTPEVDRMLAGFNEEELAKLVSFEAATEAPSDFASYDENIPVEHTCPKCGYAWSGGSNASADDADDAAP